MLANEGVYKTSLMLSHPPPSVTYSSEPKTQVSLNGIRILIVDDDHNTLLMLSELLSSYDAEVMTAGSVTAALVLYRSWMPRLLLSDLGMPERDGYDLIRSIHALPQGPPSKAIAITGFSRDEDRKRALADGYDIFLTKPVELEQLINLIAEISQT